MDRVAGISAFGMGLIYISAFVFFGAFWPFPSDGSPIEKMTFLAENQLIFNIAYTLMYLVFAILLGCVVVNLYEKLKSKRREIAALASLFGAVWVGLVIASGMIANIGLAYALGLMEVSVQKAFDTWGIIYLMVESLGGGNELVGGLWVLLISIAALQIGLFSRPLNFIGVLVGVAGIATIYPDDIFTEIFGISQIVWFIWLGFSLLRLGRHSQKWEAANSIPSANS
ncbi:hypothetical protein ACJJIE_09270 [Microbulbifer sp. TRSA001]|uniref:hypothetical protein n=1 Tax=unclassified Microbulbifer TaxID=2619833 RepID=UPI0024AD8C83|nr:hypothetical protein [Microbulbifer sp. VAAF005]WHI47906.1 hypothetical protein P0078_05805 [Microbulbifer sp. VAAF005]